MRDCIDLSTVVPLGQMRGDTDQDTEMLIKLSEEASAFIQGFDWCAGVRDRYFGCGVGGVVGVFFFRIAPRGRDIDECLWVVVGDVPPAYLVTDESRTPLDALRTYISEMRRWVAAAEIGEPVDDLIPVNAAATPQMALALKQRLDFLEREFLSSRG